MSGKAALTMLGITAVLFLCPDLVSAKYVTVACVTQGNRLPQKALDRAAIPHAEIGEANISSITVAANRAEEAKSILEKDWETHHYSMAIRGAQYGWLHFNPSKADPIIYHDPYWREFLSQRWMADRFSIRRHLEDRK